MTWKTFTLSHLQLEVMKILLTNVIILEVKRIIYLEGNCNLVLKQHCEKVSVSVVKIMIISILGMKKLVAVNRCQKRNEEKHTSEKKYYLRE